MNGHRHWRIGIFEGVVALSMAPNEGDSGRCLQVKVYTVYCNVSM